MTNEHKTIAIAALLSSGLFLLVFGLQLGFIFMFLPTLPLFSAGLSKHPRAALAAGALAALPIAGLADSGAGAFFLLIFALPSWYLCHMALKSRVLQLSDKPGMQLRVWFPVGVVIIHLAVYACALLALATAFYATQDTNLPQLISRDIAQELTRLEKIYDVPLHIAAPQIAFMLCALMAWIWGATLWLHGWLADHALAKRRLALRPNLSITPFPMPIWLLTLLGICALAALIGGESMQFLGRACVIMLLLPYAFQGAAIMHFASLTWPNRRILLFFAYVGITVFLWPALLLILVGLWHHLKTLNKQLQAGGTSSR